MSKSIEDYKSELMRYYAAHRILPVAARPVRPQNEQADNIENRGNNTDSGFEQTDNGIDNPQNGGNIDSDSSGNDRAFREQTAPTFGELPRPDAQIEDDTRREHEDLKSAPPAFLNEGLKKEEAATDYKPPENIPEGRSGEGSLVVIVTHSKGLYPVENAIVRVAKKNGEPIISELTDANGKTPPLMLAAPSKIYSESPGESSSNVLEGYNVRIDADGFVSVIIENVPIFDGVKTLQPMDLVAISAAPSPGPTVIKFNNSYTL